MTNVNGYACWQNKIEFDENDCLYLKCFLCAVFDEFIKVLKVSVIKKFVSVNS